jgi:hypothetical protein
MQILSTKNNKTMFSLPHTYQPYDRESFFCQKRRKFFCQEIADKSACTGIVTLYWRDILCGGLQYGVLPAQALKALLMVCEEEGKERMGIVLIQGAFRPMIAEPLWWWAFAVAKTAA